MKKWIIGVIAAVLVLGVYVGLRRSPDRTSGRVQVVTSGYVPYTLARQIGGEWVDVIQLLPPGAEPHGFEPTPGSMVAVHRADVFLYVSDRLEPWVKDVLGAAGKRTHTVELAQGVSSGDDPHVWMDFGSAVEMARTLTGTLVLADPAHAADYRANLALLERDIAVLDRDFARVLASCKHQEIVHIGHLAFGALARRYKLSLTALAGTSHEGEHSARKLADLVKQVRGKNIPALFTEDAVSPRLAEAVAAETGAEILPLYTVEHVSKNDFNNGVTYVELMRRNLDSLQRGLVCEK